MEMICFTCIILILTFASGCGHLIHGGERDDSWEDVCSSGARQFSWQGDLPPDSAEYLYKKLFSCYNTNVRPVTNMSAPLTIHLSVDLKSLEKIDMKMQRQKARVILELRWKDDNLVWEPSKYRNVTRFTVQSNKLWLPDLTVESETGSFEFIKMDDIGKAVVDFKGTVTLWPSIFSDLGMHLEISKYPFDNQDIMFLFASWSYNSKQVTFKLDNDYSPLSVYQSSGEWQMMNYTLMDMGYTFAGSNFDRIGYKFTVRRRWLYYVMNVIGPVVIACLLNLLVFLLPAASGQRVTLAISIFLSLTVFLSQIESSMPRTSVGVSILVIYLFLQIIGSVLTIFVSVLVIYLNERAATSEQPASSKVLSILCRSVVPNQAVNSVLTPPTNARKQVSHVPGEEEEDTCLRQRALSITPTGHRKSDMFRRNMLVLASEYINRTCLWLSVIWNIVLLIAVIVVGSTT